MNFDVIKKAVDKQFDKMTKSKLFVTAIDKDKMWETYLKSFPEGSNPIYKERTEHDCQCCKQFIRAYGNVVTINEENKLISIWDIDIGGHYQVVADAMSKFVKSKPIENVFVHYEQNLGTDYNRQMLENAEVIVWKHFYYSLPKEFVMSGDRIGTHLSNIKSAKDVFKRGLEEITTEAIEVVLELIEQNSLYRGKENQAIVEQFQAHKLAYDKIDKAKKKDRYCWINSLQSDVVSRIRNTAIGTLLTDISIGVELDKAVRSFEAKVAPTNYKRPTAIVTKSMIQNAQKIVQELGLESALHRRYATVEDITINNILFADRSTKKEMSVFEELVEEAPTNTKNLKKVEEVDIETFINTILPKVNSVELLFENKHTNNLMSLIAPVHDDVKRLFKWHNNFSWSYNGEVTDSIKERVKKAGGNINGVLRCSLSWFNTDDLDIHVIEPKGNHIYFGDKKNYDTTGVLDVDMNVRYPLVKDAVENIVWTDKKKMQEGKYTVFIHNFNLRETTDVGFEVEIEYEGNIQTFSYNKKVSDKVTVAEFEFSRKDGIKFIKSLPSTTATKKVWGINTNSFHKVRMIMNSPNYWNDKAVGNKHYFFILEHCLNDKKARGFFNEFLNDDLREYRKVFELLGSKMKTEISTNQLSGLGFSSTQKNSVICKVSGAFTRTLKINF